MVWQYKFVVYWLRGQQSGFLGTRCHPQLESDADKKNLTINVMNNDISSVQ